MAKGAKSQKNAQKFWVNFILILICIVWMVPIIGILVTSFRPSQDVFTSGWWTVLPHRENIEVSRIDIDDAVDVDGPITIEGVTATFDEWRTGIQLDDGRFIQWYGNKRTRELIVYNEQWVGFSTSLTLKNYQDVIGGKTIQYKDAQGNTITRIGNNLGGAFLNSLAVTIPGTIIPILIAAFAAFGFAWLNFPGRNILFTVIVALLVVPLQIALVPILQDYVSMGLNGTFLGIWLAHAGFGLPLATYLLFNYISTLPREILELAYIDGAVEFHDFYQFNSSPFRSGISLIRYFPVSLVVE